jgi:sulfur carrier protein ThiS
MKLTVNGLIREVAAETSVEELVNTVYRSTGPGGTHAPPPAPAGPRRAGRARPPARPATGRPGGGIVVTINGATVPRSAWARTTLADGDRVEILSAADQV